jgi:8-oxo-dGTP diphosphatase
MEALNLSTEKTLAHADIEIRVVVFCLHESLLQVLLCQPDKKHHNHPWALPAANLKENASLEESAAECVENLTGLNEVYLEQLYTYGEPERHPLQRLISVVYFALIPANSLDASTIDTHKSGWFAVDQLPLLMMDHSEILSYALRRLRYKLEYTAIGFELLPETFTLSELQYTYELILGEKLDKRNFRRRILEAGIIEATTSRRMGEGRPAQLYRYRPDAVAQAKARRLFP